MNNKDLIEDIKAKLKDQQELPYREGAWEKYAEEQGQVTAPKIVLFRRLASIAAAGLAVLGVSLYLYNSQESDIYNNRQIAHSNGTVLENKSSNIKEKSPIEIPLSLKSTEILSNDSDNDIRNNGVDRSAFSTISLASISTVEDVQIELPLIHSSQASLTIVNLSKVEPKISPILETTKEETLYPELILPTVYTLASKTAYSSLSNNTTDQARQSRKMSLGDKFQLGLYVSPNRTSDQFDIGAGFLVSYALTKKISLRTGTSYNSYSVGVVKDPLEMASTEMLNMEGAQNSAIVVENSYSMRQQMILPNVNAVMGKVEAIEIPLDVTYYYNKGFYSSAGVSYSAIIKQEREAQYIDNGRVISLQENGLSVPSAIQGMNQSQTRKVKSSQDNVNPKGFSGFANFSLGKKVNINTKMSISVEPFVKVPLGQFRKSDLDYTNSGIRIITSF